MTLMTQFLVLCAQQEEVYVTRQLLWGLEVFSSKGIFFPGKYFFLVILPDDPVQEKIM